MVPSQQVPAYSCNYHSLTEQDLTLSKPRGLSPGDGSGEDAIPRRFSILDSCFEMQSSMQATILFKGGYGRFLDDLAGVSVLGVAPSPFSAVSRTWSRQPWLTPRRVSAPQSIVICWYYRTLWLLMCGKDCAVASEDAHGEGGMGIGKTLPPRGKLVRMWTIPR
jgi:hypothetical protein